MRSGSGENIILIGMPTAGKSTVGVVLAKQLGYDYIDTDLLIQQQEGCRLEEIIRSRGDEAFLDIEAGVCASLRCVRTVIATGGSVIYRAQAMEHLRTLGTLVY
ncbi:MAG: shikimate kinase, partial [Oscillospiraceae bacterium]|nr:shikimate kinase [Oscillospiraceae bacterium]